MGTVSEKEITLRFLSQLNESQTRWFVAREALHQGRGGITSVHSLTGISRPTIHRGIHEILQNEMPVEKSRVRREGGGRKKIEVRDGRWVRDLERILEENTAGDPMSALHWTHKSTRKLASELQKQGHSVSADTVSRRLHELEYSLQTNEKTLEGSSPEERDEQFRYINREAKAFWSTGNPVLSVDAKKRELVGAFKNKGQTWRRKKSPIAVNVYDFPSLSNGVAIPYGAYDVNRNEGFINVGISHNTAQFAVESIRRWWRQVGSSHYPRAKKLLVCADGGGSNGVRNRLWKLELSKLAREIKLEIFVCHYPKGTSKWNKVEHRLFSFVSLNWAGVPLMDYETVISLISSTHTTSGLKVKAILDKRNYESGIKVSDEEMQGISITVPKGHEKWNYVIHAT